MSAPKDPLLGNVHYARMAEAEQVDSVSDEPGHFSAELAGKPDKKSDKVFKILMGCVAAAILMIAIASFIETRGSSEDSSQAATDASAARVDAAAVRASLDAQQLVVDRAGCVAGVYSRFYLAVAIDANPDSPKMQASREELRALIAGEVCPVPDLGEVAPETQSEVG